MDMKDVSLEELLYQFMDQCKLLFFPEQWNHTLLDYSKNEAFTLLFVYRKGPVNMTEIADYLGVPLNTVTGIVSRLEKRDVLKRERDKDDKRIVVVNMSPSGRELVKQQLKEIEYYFELVMSKLTTEEMDNGIKLVSKILDIFRHSNPTNDSNNTTTKKIKRILIE